MLVFVGLGNPGPKYESNRHNIGFMAVDEIVRRHSFGAWRAKFKGQVAEGFLAGEKVLCLKPATFMNDSGRAVADVVNFYKLDPSEVTVLYDDLDLPMGKVRFKQGGGHGGHNGLRSIDTYVGKDFQRVRIGIGHPGEKHRVHGHVLSDFAKAELPLAEKVLDAVAENAGALAAGRPDQFMNRVSLALNPPPRQDKDAAKTGAKD